MTKEEQLDALTRIHDLSIQCINSIQKQNEYLERQMQDLRRQLEPEFYPIGTRVLCC